MECSGCFPTARRLGPYWKKMSDQQTLPAVTILGRTGCPLAWMIRDFLTRSDVPFDWVELQNDGQAHELAGVSVVDDSRLPVLLFSDGTRLENPTIRRLSQKFGWFHDPTRSEYDLAIYGGGPAGLSAAVYGASEGLNTVLIERSAIGGQAGTSSKIENYLGFPDGISGADFAQRARDQAGKFGAEILIAREGVRGEFLPGRGVGYLADGTKIIARSTICATGVEYRRLGLPNEDRLLGAGVYYGAGASEASLCGGEDVFVVGGGNSAGQAAMHFSRSAKSVTIIVRGDSLRDTLSQYLVDRIDASATINVMTHSSITALNGEATLESIELTDNKTGRAQVLPTRWLFVCIGGMPHTAWAQKVGIVRDPEGYLVTGPDLPPGSPWPLRRNPYFLETNMPGVFAAGDVRHGSIKRCASAAGEGAMAVAFVHRYLAGG
jgi:thioredoxin reductase (NADPH)